MDQRRFIALTAIVAAAAGLGISAPAYASQSSGHGVSAVNSQNRGGDGHSGGDWGWDWNRDRDHHGDHYDHYDYYLALGDSLAVGVQPNAAGASLPTNQGYANDLAARLREHDRGLKFVDLGCSGETTTTMLVGGCPYPHPYTSQIAAATSFLKEHRNARILVTLDIGANNVDGCTTASGINTSCVAAGLQLASSDLPKILSALTEAAGRHVQFTAMNYYDPFLASWLTGAAGQQEATASIQLLTQLNGLLTTNFKAFGVKVADVASQFRSTQFTPTVPLTPTLTVPLNVARICQWTWMCAPAPQGPNIHANKAGYQQIAEAFEAVLRR